jgi:hypothetical protein
MSHPIRQTSTGVGPVVDKREHAPAQPSEGAAVSPRPMLCYPPSNSPTW